MNQIKILFGIVIGVMILSDANAYSLLDQGLEKAAQATLLPEACCRATQRSAGKRRVTVGTFHETSPISSEPPDRGSPSRGG